MKISSIIIIDWLIKKNAYLPSHKLDDPYLIDYTEIILKDHYHYNLNKETCK